jgi:wobble nucleotide-excising tRNase
LEASRDQVAQLVEDAESIKNAVAEVAREEAETRLAAAGETIDKYFRQLSRNPAVQQLKLAVTADKRTRRNSYDITDQDGEDLTPILSQGDLNALALAIFLGLATAAKEGSTFRFLMLDDPSQSLGSEHKKQLARLLDQVARHKSLIVATMDTEFHDCLNEEFTKAKREYRFGNWTPTEGPTITTMETVASDASFAGRTTKGRPERARR